MLALQLIPPEIIEGEIIAQPKVVRFPAPEIDYWQHFNFNQAARAFLSDIQFTRKPMPADLPKFAGLRKRNYTYRSYRKDFKSFLGWLDDRFPTEQVMRSYIHHLQRQKLSSNTINTYLAPARLFIKHLAKSLHFHLVYLDNPAEMFLLSQLQTQLLQVKESLLEAAKVPAAIPDDNTTEAALDRYGTRLSQESVAQILAAIRAEKSLRGLRDYALWMCFIFTGLRVSSIAQVRLSAIKEEAGSTWTLKLRHKGNKTQTVAIDELAVRAIYAYVNAYNSTLEADDPRRIGQDDVVWRTFKKGSRHFADLAFALRPMEEQGIRNVIKSRSEAAGFPVTPHDLRRTWAKWARDLKMDIVDASEQLCHASVEQTQHYMGKARDFTRLNIANQGGFTLKATLGGVGG